MGARTGPLLRSGPRLPLNPLSMGGLDPPMETIQGWSAPAAAEVECQNALIPKPYPPRPVLFIRRPMTYLAWRANAAAWAMLRA